MELNWIPDLRGWLFISRALFSVTAHSSMALKVPGQGRVQKGRPVSLALLDVASEHGGGAAGFPDTDRGHQRAY